MVLSGGSADKMGAALENSWILRRLTEVLDGSASSLHLEPLNADGAELWIETPTGRHYDQVKFRSSGSWTLGRLVSDEVITRVLPHYAAGANVTFVLSTSSDDFDRLIVQARAATTFSDFETIVDHQDLRIVATAWHASAETSWQYLRASSVRHENLRTLDDFVRLKLETLVVGDGSTTASIVQSWFIDLMQVTVTAPYLLKRLENAGLSIKPASSRRGTPQKLRASVQRQVSRVSDFMPPNGSITRKEHQELLDLVLHTRDVRIVLVHGRAGAGKSALATEVLTDIDRMGHHTAAVRLDRIPSSTGTARQVGLGMELEYSPAVVLYELASDGADAVLLVDQLDAVSTYSGRMPDTFDVVSDLIREVRALGRVRLLLVARTVDLEQDPRMRQLASHPDVRTFEVGELDETDVKNYLQSAGESLESIDSVTLSLLRVPIQLYVFCRLEPSSKRDSFRTLADLYSEYTRTFRKRLETRGYPGQWADVAASLTARMNFDETLSAPSSVLDPIPSSLVDALVSMNVLSREGDRFSFFHETYFDFLFARTFEWRGRALVDWFVDSGQGLFRRAQLRQVLSYIAAQEKDTFVEQIVLIVKSESVRPHLAVTALSLLPAFRPTLADWRTLEPLLLEGDAVGRNILALLRIQEWFDVADGGGRVEGLLRVESKQLDIAEMVAPLASVYPERIKALFDQFAGSDPRWARIFRDIVDLGDNTATLDYALELIRTGAVEGGEDDRFDPLASGLSYALMGRRSTDFIQLLDVTLTRAIQQSDAAGELDPFEAGFLSRVDHLESLEAIAVDHPAAFINAVFPLIVRVAVDHNPDGSYRYSKWSHRIKSAHHDLDDDLYFAFRSALRAWVGLDYESARPLLDRMSKQQSAALDFLTSHAMLAAPPDDAVRWLLERPEHLTVGWSDSPNWESRELIVKASQTCSERYFEMLEDALVDFAPDYELSARSLAWRGSTELDLLSALDGHRITTATEKRLAELARKFPNWNPSPPRGVHSIIMRSPIPPPATAHMTDAQWLGAIKRYRGSGIDYRDDFAIGGSWELAQLLGATSKSNPARFAALASSFPPATPAEYTDQVIRNVSGQIELSSLVSLCHKFASEHPKAAGRSIYSALEASAAPLTDEVFDLLLILAGDDDPEINENLDDVEKSDMGQRLVTVGLNSVRGQLARLVAQTLFSDKTTAARLTPIVEELCRDPHPAVRSMTSEAVLALFNVDMPPALDLAKLLLEDDLLLTTSPSMRLLRFAVLNDPGRFADVLDRGLEGPDPKAAGAVWANAWVNDAVRSRRFAQYEDLNELARCGVAEALSANPFLDPDLIAKVFSDPALAVRDSGANALRAIDAADDQKAGQLANQFIESTSFVEHLREAFRVLVNAHYVLPEMALSACDSAVTELEFASDQRRHGRALVASEVIAVIVRLYRQNPGSRNICLDLIDRLVVLRVWGLDEALEKVR
jgi:hypothetical protein